MAIQSDCTADSRAAKVGRSAVLNSNRTDAGVRSGSPRPASSGPSAARKRSAPPSSLATVPGRPDALPANLPAVDAHRGQNQRTTAPTPPREATRAEAPVVLDTTAQPLHRLRNRARSKHVTEAIAEGLSRLDSPLRFAYASTLRCAQILTQDGATVTGKYCRQRWCLVCNRIRTAKLIGAYLPVLATWADPHFVTLTVPNVAPDALLRTVDGLLKLWGRNGIPHAIRRTDGLEFRALRKLEVTYNPRRKDCHPHGHFIVDGRAAADALVRRHLLARPDADPKAQNVKSCAGPGAMRELFKYFTKMLVKGADGQRTAPHPVVLDVLFKAMRKRRTFQPMGFTVPKAEPDDESLTLDENTASPDADRGRVLWEWSGTLADWVDYNTGETLSGYDPPATMRELVERIRADAAKAPQ